MVFETKVDKSPAKSDGENLPKFSERPLVVKNETIYSNFELEVSYRDQLINDMYHYFCSDVNIAID